MNESHWIKIHVASTLRLGVEDVNRQHDINIILLLYDINRYTYISFNQVIRI